MSCQIELTEPSFTSRQAQTLTADLEPNPGSYFFESSLRQQRLPALSPVTVPIFTCTPID